MEKLIEIFATGFYLGKIPKAPGTFGTLVGIPLFLLFSYFGDMAYILLTAVSVMGAIVVADLYESQIGGHDKPEIVIDEIVGYLITMALLPVKIEWIILGFILFRFFDILKPYPISYLNDRAKGGFGVVVDDVAAGIAASILLQILYQTLNPF